MKKNLTILGIIVLVLVVIGVMKDQIIKSIVTTSASQIIGAPLEIGSLSMGFLKQSIVIKDLKLYNPPGYDKEVLLDMPTISVDYDLSALLKGELHLSNAIVDLHEAVIVKNKEGKLNVDSLKVVEEQKNAAPAAKETNPQKQMPMKIDVMTLSIGKVVFKNYENKDKPTIEAYDVGIKAKTFKNITSAQQFITLILVEALKPTAIKSAAVYGAATVLGVAFLPAGIAATLMGDDTSKSEFKINFEKVYKVCLAFMKEKGNVASENQGTGMIKAKVEGHDVTVKVIKKTPDSVEVQVSARKYMLPKQQYAGGLLYQISEKLK